MLPGMLLGLMSRFAVKVHSLYSEMGSWGGERGVKAESGNSKLVKVDGIRLVWDPCLDSGGLGGLTARYP